MGKFYGLAAQKNAIGNFLIIFICVFIVTFYFKVAVFYHLGRIAARAAVPWKSRFCFSFVAFRDPPSI
jgi:hypothetical protein